MNRNLVFKSDSGTDDEEDVLDIMSIIWRKFGGKRILVNVFSTHMDNVSFHSEISVQKWKCVSQTRIAVERELGKEAFDCK